MKKKNPIIVKLTERQLREAQDAFEYLTNSDSTPNDGQVHVSATGKLDGTEEGDPMTTDQFASTMTVQGANRFRLIRGTYPMGVQESDENKDGVDDFYQSDELDVLSDGDKSNNLTSIPASVEAKVDALLDTLKSLPAKKSAIVLNKFVEQMNLKGIPNTWKRELIKKLTVAAQ